VRLLADVTGSDHPDAARRTPHLKPWRGKNEMSAVREQGRSTRILMQIQAGNKQARSGSHAPSGGVIAPLRLEGQRSGAAEEEDSSMKEFQKLIARVDTDHWILLSQSLGGDE
jgi:hypothetical protein